VAGAGVPGVVGLLDTYRVIELTSCGRRVVGDSCLSRGLRIDGVLLVCWGAGLASGLPTRWERRWMLGTGIPVGWYLTFEIHLSPGAWYGQGDACYRVVASDWKVGEASCVC
jgi:hypothetical protein